MFWLWTFAIYWLLLFVACYIVVEVGQNYFYDEVTPLAWLKVGGSTLLLAGALTWRELGWESSDALQLFLDHVWFTGLLGIAAFVLFILAIRFHAPHALLLGPPTVVLVAFIAAMAVDSFENTGRANFRDRPIPAKQRTIRKSAGTSLDAPIEEPPPEARGAAPAPKGMPPSGKAMTPGPRPASP